MTKAFPSVLVTGFQPFGGQTVNPSWLAVSRLPEEIGHAPIHRAELPVKWFAVLDCLEALAEVSQAVVSHENGTAVVTLSGEVSEDVLKKAVEDQDYKVVSIQ